MKTTSAGKSLSSVCLQEIWTSAWPTLGSLAVLGRREAKKNHPVKDTGCPLNRGCYHAAPELAKDAQTCWHRRPMITTTVQWLAEVGKVKVNNCRNSKACVSNYAFVLCFSVFRFCFFLFLVPLSFAEFVGIGRANSPWMANLVLCARTAHQDVLVGNTNEFRHPERFSRGKRSGRPFLVTLCGC